MCDTKGLRDHPFVTPILGDLQHSPAQIRNTVPWKGERKSPARAEEVTSM
jgi:hypothetical protein